MSLAEVCCQQRRLAYYAPATAMAINMHLYWTGMAADLWRGGYRFTGHKHFGSLTPVWTFLGLNGAETNDKGKTKIIHAFMPRSAEGYSIKETSAKLILYPSRKLAASGKVLFIDSLSCICYQKMAIVQDRCRTFDACSQLAFLYTDK